MKRATPAQDFDRCLFSVFRDLAVKLHESNSTFLSETLEKPPEKRSFNTVMDWFRTTTTNVVTTMKEFLQDARFAWLQPVSLDDFFEKFQKTCFSMSFSDNHPTPLSILGKFLFWSCLDKTCHVSVVESFEHMKNAKWACGQSVDSSSDRLKWSFLCSSQYSIGISTTTIFNHIQHEMKLVAELPANKLILTNLLVRLLMAKDIIPRSIQFYSQIGPSCKRFNNLKISDRMETDNVSLAVTDNFFEHIRDKNPRPRKDALVKKNMQW